MKYSIFLIPFLLFLFIITCTEEPAGPDISDDLKPKGNIIGYIFDMWNKPIKDVLVSVDADSAVPGVSKETGLFTVGKVMKGTYVLRFTHRDYDNDSSYMVTIEQGVDDTLTDTVRLSYAYYILKGRVVYNTSPVPGAGISAAGYPLTTLTDESGIYVLDKIPKIPSLKLICAKSGLGFNTHSSITGIEDDTTRIGDIPLIFKGATVSGTVYDTSGAPVRSEVVAAVGGGLVDTTNSKGEYVIENIPCNESSVRIYVLTSDSLFYGATSGIDVRDTSIVPNVDIHLRPTSDLQNGNGMAIQVLDMVVVDTISAVQLNVYPWTDVHTVIHSFIWSLKGQVSSRNDTTKDAFLSLTKNDLNALAGSVGSRNISVSIHARNTEGGLSQKQYFTIMIRTFAPMVSAGGSPTEGGTPQDSVSIELNETVYFTADIDDPFGGIDTIEWDFGDETGKWYSTDGLANVGHAFPKEGNFLSVLRVKDTDGNEARDTVAVEVNQSQLDPPQNISPPDKDTVWTLSDNATLFWHKVASSQAVLYDVYLDSLNDPAGILYKPDVSDTSLLVTIRKDNTYHWKIVAKSGGNTSTGKTWTFTVKSSDTTNHAPSFTDSTGSMTSFATVGKEYKDTLNANDPDGDTLSFSFLESPTGMSLTGNIINWTPTIADVGENPVHVQVSDGKGGLDSLSWTINVNDTTGKLVAYYPFNGNANDESGNGNHGTVNGAVLTTDRFGNTNSAYIFDGIDDEIKISDHPSLQITKALTLEAWINPYNFPGNIIGKTGQTVPYQLWINEHQYINFHYVYNGTDFDFFGSEQITHSGIWQHIVFTFYHGIKKLYYNGKLIGEEGSLSDTLPNYPSDVDISGDPEKFSGIIDDIRIYSRALDATEIDSLYHLNGWPLQIPPVFTDTSMTKTATVNEEYKETLRAIDPNGDTLTFSLLESPAGMSLTDSIITWTPAITDTGVNPVQAQVSDGKDGYDSLSWTITVNDTTGKLVAYYPFNGNANDESGNNNNGTVYGNAALTTDRFGNANRAYSFDGVDDFIEILDHPSLQITEKLTLEVWINPQLTSLGATIISKQGSCTPYELSNPYESNNTFTLNFHYSFNNSDWDEFNVLNTPHPGIWQQVVFTFNHGTMKLYYNGNIIITQEALSDTLPNGPSNVSISKEYPASFGGSIDDVRIYNRALNAAEIDSLYHLNGWQGNAPVITTDPQPVSVNLGQTATYGVIANGDKPFTYKWQKDSIDIAGATDSSYTTPATTINDNGAKFRCIVTNSLGSDTSDEAVLTVIEITDSVADADGNVYHAVTIGNQVWTIENLRTTKYNDSTDIPHVKDNGEWWACSTGTGAHCYYNNTTDTDSIEKFGALYNWYAVDTNNHASIAPEGWHVPTDAELDTLQNYLIANGYNWDGTTTGNKIAKSMAAKTGWDTSNIEEGTPGYDMSSNNTSGFSAFPSGLRNVIGDFYGFGGGFNWWSATERDASDAHSRHLGHNNYNLIRDLNTEKEYGLTVRLVRD